MPWPFGIKLAGPGYFIAFRPASNDKEKHSHEKIKGKINGKEMWEIRFHLSHERLLYLDVCLSFSGVNTVRIPPRLLPDGALNSLRWISAEKNWHPVTFPHCMQWSWSVSAAHLLLQEQSLLFTADIPQPRQTLMNTLMYWALPLTHLSPLLWMDSLLQ